MKSLRKFKKSMKALSPVVASIILIAVTVAVSIAVAAWMGGMTIGFMGSTSVTVTNVDFNTNSTISLDLKNTGTKSATIATVKINNQPATITASGANTTLTLNAGDILRINIDGAPAHWVNGNTYKIDLYDPNNQVIGSTQVNAPGA
jgi:flagellin-like protein